VWPLRGKVRSGTHLSTVGRHELCVKRFLSTQFAAIALTSDYAYGCLCQNYGLGKFGPARSDLR